MATSALRSVLLRPRVTAVGRAWSSSAPQHPELENSRRKEENEDEEEEQDSAQTTESLRSGVSDTLWYGWVPSPYDIAAELQALCCCDAVSGLIQHRGRSEHGGSGGEEMLPYRLGRLGGT